LGVELPKNVTLSCLSCSGALGNSFQVCSACDARGLAPSECPHCGSQIKNLDLKKGQISAIAGRIRSCPNCAYDFFLPRGLASVLTTMTPTPLSEQDLEALFFLAWSYQMSAFGGSIPSIECDYEIAMPIYEQWLEKEGHGDGSFSESWLDSYFPILEDHVLFNLALKYWYAPQLFYTAIQIVEDDEVFDIELSPAVDASKFEDVRVRSVLLESLSLSGEVSEPSLIQAIKAFLEEEDVFDSF
jgi:hypothetical protein